MTEDADPSAPSSSSTPAAATGASSRHGARPGARSGARRDDRALLESIETNLGFMRPELERLGGVTREHAGRLAEELPRLDDLDERLAVLRGQVDALAGAEPDEKTAPPYDDAALRAAGLAPAPGHQVDWHLMSAEQALPAWEALAAWVAAVVCGRLGFTRAQLPDCWALHPDLVAELSWAHQLHRAYAGPGVGPLAVAEWHTRWLPHLHSRLGALVRLDTVDPYASSGDHGDELRPRCRPGHYHRLTLEQRRRAEHDLNPVNSRPTPARPHPPQHRPMGKAPAGLEDVGDTHSRPLWITGTINGQRVEHVADRDRAERDQRRAIAQLALDHAGGHDRDTARRHPERPRYLLAHPGDDHPGPGAPALHRAEPRHWLGYYFEAAHTDLARRRHREHHDHPRPVEVTLEPSLDRSHVGGHGEGRARPDPASNSANP